MPKKKGTEKTGGRKQGTPNKVTGEVKTWLSQLIDKNRRQIERDIKALEPKDRLNILEKLMQYTVPKMQNIDGKIDFGKLTDEQLNQVINELTKEL
jgi:uncharacterized protein (UPF0305 family)